jgi:hypothetical protein
MVYAYGLHRQQYNSHGFVFENATALCGAVNALFYCFKQQGVTVEMSEGEKKKRIRIGRLMQSTSNSRISCHRCLITAGLRVNAVATLKYRAVRG